MNTPKFIVRNAPYHMMDHPKSVHKGLTGIPQREITLTEHVIVAADHLFYKSILAILAMQVHSTNGIFVAEYD